MPPRGGRAGSTRRRLLGAHRHHDPRCRDNKDHGSVKTRPAIPAGTSVHRCGIITFCKGCAGFAARQYANVPLLIAQRGVVEPY